MNGYLMTVRVGAEHQDRWPVHGRRAQRPVDSQMSFAREVVDDLRGLELPEEEITILPLGDLPEDGFRNLTLDCGKVASHAQNFGGTSSASGLPKR